MTYISRKTLMLYNQLVADLYRFNDASGFPEFVLSRLERVVPFDSAALFNVDPATQRFYRPAFIGLDPDRFAEYSEYYESHDLFKRRVYALNQVPPAERSTDFMDYSQWKKNEHFADFLRPQGIHYLAGIEVFRGGQLSATVSIHRTASNSDFTNEELLLLSESSIHLSDRFSGIVIESSFDQIVETFVKQHSITERETEVLNLLVTGLKTEQIADRLNISPNTAKIHIRNLYKKLNVSSRGQLTHQLLTQSVDLSPKKSAEAQNR